MRQDDGKPGHDMALQAALEHYEGLQSQANGRIVYLLAECREKDDEIRILTEQVQMLGGQLSQTMGDLERLKRSEEVLSVPVDPPDPV